jgi:hypothetical protein
VFLTQAEELCRAVDPWLGWRPGAHPLIVSFVQGGNLLIGVSHPPAGFRPVAAGARADGGSSGSLGGDGSNSGGAPNRAELTAFYRPGFLDQRTLGTGALAGRPRFSEVGDELVPSVSFSPGRDPLASFSALVREAFQVQVALQLASRVDAKAGVIDETDLEGLMDEGGAAKGASSRGGRSARSKGRLLEMAAMLRECQEAFERYPESSVMNNVHGNLEGNVLYGLLIKDGFAADVARETGGVARETSEVIGEGVSPSEASDERVGPQDAGGGTESLARTVALIRRERWAQLNSATIAYERRMEIYEGLPRFVELELLRALALGTGAASPDRLLPEFVQLMDVNLKEAAARLVRTRFGLLTQLNRRGWGASRRRFYHSGMGLGYLLDATVPGWRGEVGADHRPLDLILEDAVTFDGGDTDEKLIELARRRYGYYECLEDERAWAEDMGEKRRALLAKVLEAEGTRITVDVSALNEKSAWYDTGSAERIGEAVVVHIRPGVFTYGDGTTFVEFRGIATVEDRRAKLFHLTVPGTNLAVFGDEDRLPGHKGAEFTEGLDVDLAGFRVRAQRGTVHRDGALLFISLLA